MVAGATLHFNHIAELALETLAKKPDSLEVWMRGVEPALISRRSTATRSGRRFQSRQADRLACPIWGRPTTAVTGRDTML